MNRRIKLTKKEQTNLLADDNFIWVKKQTPHFFYYLANWSEVKLHLYQNGTLLLQGREEDVEAFQQKWASLITQQYWFGKQFIQPYFGGDESGVGDLFGPIVFTIFLLDEKIYHKIKDLNLQDSKTMTTKKIFQIAPQLMEYSHNFTSQIISNQELNKALKKMNLKELMSFSYLEMIRSWSEFSSQSPVIIDGYIKKTTFDNYVAKFNWPQLKNLTFVPRAENKYLAVAAASIISRFLFLQEIEKISTHFNKKILLGASNQTKQLLQALIAREGLAKMNNFAKLTYKREIN